MSQENNHSVHPHQAPQGTILEVKHSPLLNGEKIHTSIILKGHPLPVIWRNTNTHHTSAPELQWKEENCIYCQQCSQVCQSGCLHTSDDGLEIDDENCDLCGSCLKECPSMALEIVGKKTTAGELLHKTLKQNYSTARKIAQFSITGGEPGLQTAFCADLLFQIGAAGIPAIMETSGLAPFDQLLPLLSLPIQISYELITPNDQMHTRLTGYGNTLILENLEKVSNEISRPTKLVVRTPLIRDETAAKTPLSETGLWLTTHLIPTCHRWELFEPLSICNEITPFSDQEWIQIGQWAVASGFPEEKIRLISRNNLAPKSANL
jgi:pyruvate formate lyase activating enzyme